MRLEDELRRLGDALRIVADNGLLWSTNDPYNTERYEQVRRIASQIFALADTRPPDVIEREVFSGLTHLAPVAVGDAAIFNGQSEILLIRRSDDRLWAMPGGGFNPEETPAEGVCREALEETGMMVEPVALMGVYDSRFCETAHPIQLYQFVFQCRVTTDLGEPAHAHEVIDMAWFGSDKLPPLSPGHTVRVPDAFEFLKTGEVFFDR